MVSEEMLVFCKSQNPLEFERGRGREPGGMRAMLNGYVMWDRKGREAGYPRWRELGKIKKKRFTTLAINIF